MKETPGFSWSLLAEIPTTVLRAKLGFDPGLGEGWASLGCLSSLPKEHFSGGLWKLEGQSLLVPCRMVLLCHGIYYSLFPFPTPQCPPRALSPARGTLLSPWMDRWFAAGSKRFLRQMLCSRRTMWALDGRKGVLRGVYTQRWRAAQPGLSLGANSLFLVPGLCLEMNCKGSRRLQGHWKDLRGHLWKDSVKVVSQISSSMSDFWQGVQKIPSW